MTNDSNDLVGLLARLGFEPEVPAWRVTSVPPIEPARFGKDHYSTLAYVEIRAVDHRGMLDHEHLRCDPARHPMMQLAKTNTLTRHAMAGLPMPTRKYPTRLADGIEQPDHDDYDCLDDMLAAGWLTVEMPHAEPSLADPDLAVFIDAWGKPVVDGAGDLVNPAFLTGMGELWLCTRARWGLTEHGQRVVAALRQHKADGGSFATFQPPEET